MQEAVGILVQVDFAITDFTSPAYLRLRLKRPLSKEVPNRSVDLSSWERSACYPRSTFYPLSDGNPIFLPPDHFALVSNLVDLYVSQSSPLLTMLSSHGCHSC